MNEDQTPAVDPFWDQLQADFANLGDAQLWRVGAFLLIGGAAGLYVRFLYDRLVKTAADSDPISRVFPVLIVVTACIIAVIKSSLALSLGLVGALSIVRFRAAIKEPEELVYLFLCVGLGICLGAEQLAIALLMTAAVSILIVGARVFGRGARRHCAVVTITGDVTQFTEGDAVLSAVDGLARQHTIQRYDIQEGDGQLRVLIGQILPEEATELMRGLRQRLPDCQLSYVNVERI